MKTLLNCLAVAALTVAPCLAAGSAAAQARRAPAAQARTATVAEVIRGLRLDHQQFTLPNGLRVVVHTDRKAPVVNVAVWYNVGSKDEPRGRTGFAHLFEHMMFEPTENIENQSELLENLGSPDLNGTTWFDRTNYYETVPTAALEQALFIESERMGHLLPALDQNRLNVQRAVVQNEKRQNDNQPFGLVYYAVHEALFPEGHPYRHATIGSMADLDAASLEDVRSWFRENYGPNNAVLVLSGDVDVATARRLAERYFGHIPRGPANVPAEADVTTLPRRVDLVMQDRVATTRLYRHWVAPGRGAPDMVSLDLAAWVLGGLGSSRLDNTLVRADRDAVSVTARLTPHQRLSFFEVYVDVRPGVDADVVSRRLDALIERLVREGPTADEVRRAAMRVARGRVEALERAGGASEALAEGALYHDDPGHVRRELQAYAAATPASVRAALGRWLSRPVLATRVNPGPRPAYQESAVAAPGASPAAEAAARPPATRPTPVIGDVAPLDLPPVERVRLGNGVEVIYARRAAAPLTHVAVEFAGGVALDRAERPGTQALMLSVMSEGTRSLNAVQLAEQRERLGASLTAGGSLDRAVFSLSAPSANADPALALMADVIRDSAFAPAEVERLRAVQLWAVERELTEPAAIARRALPALIYGPDHPYGRPATGLGTAASVRAITRDDLLAFHAGAIRPDAMQVFVVSDLPLARLRPILERRFGDWRPPSAPGSARRPPPRRRRPRPESS